jgi:hypothetical protein
MSYDQELHRWKTEAQVALRERDECAREIERLRTTLKEIAGLRYDNTSAASIASRALKDET